MSLSLKYILCFVIWVSFNLTTVTGQSDQRITGTVLSLKDNEPMTGASIYLNGTTIGAFVDEDGNFELPYDPLISEIVISYLGYQTLTYKIIPEEVRKRFKFLLEEETEDLRTVDITSTRTKSWKNNLNTFLYHFIGRSNFADYTDVLNPETLYFEKDSLNTLIAYARGPIQIENKALGYRIDYDLVKFEYNPHMSRTNLLGFSKFTVLDGSKSKNKKWMRNQKAAYKGSFSHFVHALQNNTLSDDGFGIKEMKKCPNPKRPTDAQIDSTFQLLGMILEQNDDSRSKQYIDSLQSIVNKRGYRKTVICLNKNPHDPTPDVTRSEHGMTMAFDNYWQISYFGGNTRKMNAYGSLVGKRSQISTISLLEPQVELDRYGQLIDPLSILFEGYWIQEKIPYLLPLDYIRREAQKTSLMER